MSSGKKVNSEHSRSRSGGEKQAEKKLRIGFIHPDLGIGGAERLVVDAAVALQKRGHEVVMFTSRHDPKRCFEETRDGTLTVHVLGSSLPRSIHPRFPLTIIFSILRSLLLTVLLSMSLLLPPPAAPYNPLSPIDRFDVFIVDQQSVCVPFLRLFTGTRVVFYCHFPDKLLSGGWEIGDDKVGRKEGAVGGGLLKRIYRWPVDKLEEWTTGQADVILSNSLFTSRVYARAFPSLARRTPKVVYPCIDLDAYRPTSRSKGKAGKQADGVDLIKSERPTLISLNRFEAKKNVALAIRAFSKVVSQDGVQQPDSKLRLVIAGGYDDSVPDNVTTLQYLKDLCDSLALTYATLDPQSSHAPDDTHVLFILNFTTAQRTHLLTSSKTLALLYTPANEHFGIVPIEAMACGLPVLAVNSGGPTETIVPIPISPSKSRTDGTGTGTGTSTGILCPADADEWAKALHTLIALSPSARERISKAGKKRVEEHFSSVTLGKEMEVACREALGVGADVHWEIGDRLMWWGAGLMAFAAFNLGLIWLLYGGI